MKRALLLVLLVVISLPGCRSEPKKPPQERLQEVAMSEEKPSMIDLREDAKQEERTKGQVCPHCYDNQEESFSQDFQPYYPQ